MPTRYGVSWRGKESGDLDESEIPNDDYSSHYLLDGPTKTQSSYPVVDADGNLRRGNVKSAWDLRGHAGSKQNKIERATKHFGRLFSENPLPDDAYDDEQTMSELTISTLTFAAYQFDVGDWVYYEWQGSEVHGEVRDRTKDSFTVDGNEISGEEGENVYKVEKYDTDSGEFTGEMAAHPESNVYSWDGPQEMSDIEGAALSMTFEGHSSDELDEVYSEWKDTINMTDSELERWDDHPCSDAASQNPEEVRDRNLMLLGTDKENWTEEHIEAAKRTISFVSRMASDENRPESPKEGGKGTCPSEWAISLLNWAYNPFDSLPDGDPNPGQENAALDDGDTIAFSAAVTPPRNAAVDPTEFNEYGIRENYNDDGELVSVDAVYEAMEPGPPSERNGVRITPEFLQQLAEKDYSGQAEPPHLMDHTKKTLSQIGRVKKVWYNDETEKLMLMARAYNTGSDTHDEIINRLTFTPPTIRDGSVGLGDDYEFERNDDGEIELTDGRIREFSTTPFPAGYDSGGLKTDWTDTSEASAVGAEADDGSTTVVTFGVRS